MIIHFLRYIDDDIWKDLLRLIPEECDNIECDECEKRYCLFMRTVYNDLLGLPIMCEKVQKPVLAECLTCDQEHCYASLKSKLKYYGRKSPSTT